MAYAHPTGSQNLTIFALVVILGFSLLTANLLMIAVAAAIIALFYPYTTPKRESRENDFII